MVGGHHATIRPEDFYTPYIDLIISGEGVFLFREAIVRLEKNLALSGIPGAVRLQNDAVFMQQRDQDLDIETSAKPKV